MSKAYLGIKVSNIENFISYSEEDYNEFILRNGEQSEEASTEKNCENDYSSTSWHRIIG